MNIKNNYRLFDQKTEAIFLIIPTLMVVAIPFELLFFGPQFQLAKRLEFAVIANTVFFNITHVALTYLMMLRLPEFSAWMKRRNDSQRLTQWQKTFVVYAAFVLFFSLPLYYKIENPFVGFLTDLILILPIQHMLWQVRGLSLAYNQQFRDGNQIAQIKQSERDEKRAYYILFAALAAMKAVKTEYMRGLFADAYANLIDWFFWSIVVVSGFVFLKALRGLSGINKSNKPIYLLRILSFPMVHYSAIAATATGVLHGLEYVCVFSKMNNNSQQKKDERNTTLQLGIVILIVYAVLLLVTRPGEPGTEASFMTKIFRVMSSSLVFAHYYLDRVIFRMRNEASREFIAPLLD